MRVGEITVSLAEEDRNLLREVSRLLSPEQERRVRELVRWECLQFAERLIAHDAAVAANVRRRSAGLPLQPEPSTWPLESGE